LNENQKRGTTKPIRNALRDTAHSQTVVFEDKQDHSVFFQLLLGPLVALFIALIPTKRKKIMKVFKEKESIILDLNNSIRNVLENPGIDKLLK
jgi:hypothetical protein